MEWKKIVALLTESDIHRLFKMAEVKKGRVFGKGFVG
jgi:hypothetical protein